MVSKKNAINLLIILVAVILIAAIAIRLFGVEEQTLRFSGPNVYRAVYVFDAMQKQGFSVNLRFDGRWTDTGAQISSEGLILDGQLGEFTILLGNRQVSLGGPFSSSSDLQASRIILVPNHRAVVKVGLEPLSAGTLSELNSRLENFANAVIPRSDIYETGIEGDVTIDVSPSLMPTLLQELSNVLRPQNDFVLYDNGLILKLKNANLDDMGNINQLFVQKNLSIQKVATSRLLLYVRAKEIPSESSAALLGKAKNFGLETFLLTTITKPVQ